MRRKKLPVIPLSKLNCLYCNIYGTSECGVGVFLNPSTGRPEGPEKHYCYRIGRNFNPEGRISQKEERSINEDNYTK